MAGSITTDVSRLPGGVTKTRIVWTSDAAGVVSGNPVTLDSGTIIAVEFKPGAGGVQPTDLYDVVLNDAEGVNMLNDGAGASIGANLSNVNASHKVPFVGGGTVTYVRQWLHGGQYTLGVTNAGNAKQGTVDIYQVRGVV